MTFTKPLLKSGVVVATMAIMSLFSCGRGCKPKDSNPVITIDVAMPIDSLDMRYTTSAIASRIANLVYGTLYILGDDAEPKPFLAESARFVDDLTIEMKLRSNLKFHDGTPLTAADVIYSLSELKSPDVASPHGESLDYIKSITARSDHELVFTLHEPHAPFLTDLCAIGIVAKKSCSGRSKACSQEHNGSGPYKVTNYDQAKEAIHLAPFEHWFEGAPKASLLFRIVRDENTRILELIGKKADIVDGEFSPANQTELAKYPFLEMKETAGLGYTYIALNVRGPKPDDDKKSDSARTRAALADKRVRHAIAQAIDVDQIITKVMLGTAKRVSGLIPNAHWAKDATLTTPAFDPVAAERLLDEAGFTRHGNDNMRFKLVISTTPNRMRQNTSQLYAEFLKRVGIDATLRVKDWSALYSDIKQGQFEMFSAVWVPVTDPDLYYFVHHSASVPTEDKGGGNRHGYKNSEVDRLVSLGRVTMDNEKRRVIYQEVERIMLVDLPYIPLWNEDRIVVLNKDRVGGFEPSPTGSYLGLRNAFLVENNSSDTQRASN